MAAAKRRSGWKSTKLHVALIGMASTTAVFLFVVAHGVTAGFGEYCLAMVSFVATTQGSRVAETFAQRPKET